MKSDSQLKQEVEHELMSNAAVDANGIGVAVVNGIVTLTGHVPDYARKVAAEKCALRIAGVVAVVVGIDVKLRESEQRTDEDVALSVSAVLEWIAGLEEHAIRIKVEKGWVTLSGEVEDGYRSHMAEKNIIHMRGVTGVTNNIRIRGSASPLDIEYNIRKAIQRHTDRELKHVGVEVDDGRVILSGRLSSAIERSIVSGAARSTPGVKAVVDRLVIG
ncbi:MULTISPECIES: BON domain-containing protein [Paraburkholderia]|uniref:BON domain-containing protein n=1 Tax=Paraburkholderia madseniana TaxID=2599607 RepID=A0AAP5BBL2_9BURK|nr:MULTISPECIES: BON domain-containing protein [Paraburkholderia]MCX4145121.1 BON domain-containing protein [Paraburkholderia madseniana]MDN7148072.1 BON domain-containing protein [Paraburkholderia sp. WS6]MDQ6406952.1 BON domain-containing protein [Paraburkholderia madseniana]